MANFLLAQSFKDAVKNEKFQKYFEVTAKQLEGAEKFRRALLNAFFKTAKNG